MKNNSRIRLCKYVLILNILYWSYLSFTLAFSNYHNHFLIQFLSLCEPLLYFGAWIGVVKNNKYFYLLSLFFSFGNAFLSLTDQMGMTEIITFFLSLLALVSLVMIRRQYYAKHELFPINKYMKIN